VDAAKSTSGPSAEESLVVKIQRRLDDLEENFAKEKEINN
jgi:hypothetical protein